jgi:hypothetical protein
MKHGINSCLAGEGRPYQASRMGGMGLRFKIHQGNGMDAWKDGLDGRNYWKMIFS